MILQFKLVSGGGESILTFSCFDSFLFILYHRSNCLLEELKKRVQGNWAGKVLGAGINLRHAPGWKTLDSLDQVCVVLQNPTKFYILY